MLTILELIASLNVEHAEQYAATQDQYLYVVWNLLEPNGLSERWVELVEDHLDQVMTQHNIVNQYFPAK
jgi:hypothetical protein|tara:strand:+ start:536 stop:742 length:207 start_codon:yes stop_codon:yes gene_type:complete